MLPTSVQSSRCPTALIRATTALAATALLVAAAALSFSNSGGVSRRLAAAARNQALPALTPMLPAPSSPGLASWQTIGGCGAGASTGSGSAVKWVGRGVRGGLFYLESQVNYVAVPYGYNFVSSTLVSYDFDPWWSLGVSVPYLYKFMNDPYQVRVDLANKGPGDVAFLLSRKLGDANAWKATLSVGAPTGTNDVAFRTQLLPQDRQLGLGKPTAALIVDHIIDNLWGPIVLGGTLTWRGGENDKGSYRAPSGSLYGYVGPHIGPFTPAAGVSVTGYAGKDRDLGEPQALPRVSLAPSLSLEWAGDAVALLIGASLPYDVAVESSTVAKTNRWGAWVVAVGAAFALF
ncbi:MAG TPA: hypothetical protein VGG33_25335 [Polyangia bacterium]